MLSDYKKLKNTPKTGAYSLGSWEAWNFCLHDILLVWIPFFFSDIFWGACGKSSCWCTEKQRKNNPKKPKLGGLVSQADRPKVKQLTSELLQLKCHALWVKRHLGAAAISLFRCFFWLLTLKGALKIGDLAPKDCPCTQQHNKQNSMKEKNKIQKQKTKTNKY